MRVVKVLVVVAVGRISVVGVEQHPASPVLLHIAINSTFRQI